MATIEKTIDIDCPLSAAYGQWTQFEEFPQFMDHVVEVTQLDDTHLHWVAEIGGKRQEWDAEIVQQEPDRVIAWRATSGAPNAGRVEFLPADGSGTRVMLRIDFEPDGVRESRGSALGLDSRHVENDLERFKELVESRGASGAWRGQVHAGRVTDETGAAGGTTSSMPGSELPG